MNELKAIYEAYLEAYADALAHRKFGEGLCGFGKSLSQEECHDRFYRQLEQYCAGCFSENRSSDEAEGYIRFMLAYPIPYKETANLYWMFLAVQSFALPLVDALTTEAAGRLEEELSDTYPRWDRLKPQEELLSALRNRSGHSLKRRKLWPFSK